MNPGVAPVIAQGGGELESRHPFGGEILECVVKALSRSKQLGPPPSLGEEIDNHEHREQNNNDKYDHGHTSFHA